MSWSCTGVDQFVALDEAVAGLSANAKEMLVSLDFDWGDAFDELVMRGLGEIDPWNKTPSWTGLGYIVATRLKEHGAVSAPPQEVLEQFDDLFENSGVEHLTWLAELANAAYHDPSGRVRSVLLAHAERLASYHKEIRCELERALGDAAQPTDIT